MRTGIDRRLSGSLSLAQARIAACQQMGQRVFYQQMLTDSLHGVQGRATDEIDVVTTKDYMQVRQDRRPSLIRVSHHIQF